MNTNHKYLICLITFCGFVFSAMSQEYTRKDIWDLDKVEDTIQLRIADEYLEHLTAAKSFDSALVFSKKVIEGATKYQDSVILGEAYVHKGKAYSELNKYFYAGH